MDINQIPYVEELTIKEICNGCWMKGPLKRNCKSLLLKKDKKTTSRK